MSTIISSANAPQAIGPYVQAYDLGSMVITSGQLPINAQNGEMSSDVAEQTRQALENVCHILKEAKLEAKNIVKTTVFVQDLNDFATINAAYEEFFKLHHSPSFPARSCVQVARLPKDAKLEIEAIAVR